jgi:hypothetical protein
VILRVVLTEGKVLPPQGGGYGLFSCCHSHEQAQLGPSIKKPWCIRTKAFDFVAESDEISNLGLIRDMAGINKMENVLSLV